MRLLYPFIVISIIINIATDAYLLSFRRHWPRIDTSIRISEDDNPDSKIVVPEGPKELLGGLDRPLKSFRASVKSGMEAFMNDQLQESIEYFENAMSFNSTQPLVQRGIALYCNKDFEEAEAQFCRDIEYIERGGEYKATDLRLWQAACLHKLGRGDEAIQVVDADEMDPRGYTEDRPVFKALCHLYTGQKDEKHLADAMEIIGGCGQRDLGGTIFYGNFFIGLYLDSRGQRDMAKMFLSIPKDSNRFPESDMWFHLPRMLWSSFSYRE